MKTIKSLLAIAIVITVVMFTSGYRGRYTPVIIEFGDLTPTSGNILVADGTDFVSKEAVAYENELVFYENEIVTY